MEKVPPFFPISIKPQPWPGQATGKRVHDVGTTAPWQWRVEPARAVSWTGEGEGRHGHVDGATTHASLVSGHKDHVNGAGELGGA